MNAPLERKIRVRGEILLMAILAKGDCPETRKLECWQITAHLPHAMAAAFEYVWRYREKNGAQDLQKALKWCEFERKARAEVMTRGNVPVIARERMARLMRLSGSTENAAALSAIFDSSVNWMLDLLLADAEDKIRALLHGCGDGVSE